MITVPITFTVKRIEIQFRIWDCVENIFRPGYALLDTGSSISVIGEDTAKLLGYEISGGTNDVRGFGSRDNSGNIKYEKLHYITVRNLKLGEQELGAATFHVANLDGYNSAAIIGYNILTEFNFFVDLDNNVLQLHPRFDIKDIKTVNNFSPEFSRFGLYLAENK